jgi:acyl-CoA reductase-like NAD-dependent aldehyde dehydrogenase
MLIWMDGWIEQEDMKIAQEEIFGPVMSLMKFRYVHHTLTPKLV